MTKDEMKEFHKMTGEASQAAIEAILGSEVVKQYNHMLSPAVLKQADEGLLSPDELLQHIEGVTG